MSEFPLDEAMESGLVTIPRRPRGPDGLEADDLETLYETSQGSFHDNPAVAARVTRAARLLYQDYERQFRKWERDNAATTGQRSAHPVMIAVVNNRRNAQKLHEIIGGAPRDADAERYDPPIGFDLLSNVPHRGAKRSECEQAPPRTIVVYSPGGGDASRAEGSVFTNGRLGVREAKSGEEVEEVLATVARPGTPGAAVRCVISVGMLTEGWDCPFVTSILGFRKFDSELLARQMHTGAVTRVSCSVHDRAALGLRQPAPVRERGSVHSCRRAPGPRRSVPLCGDSVATTFRAPIGERLDAGFLLSTRP